MKKILLFTFAAFFTVAHLAAQPNCNCGSIKFLVGQWKCQGKNASGFPVYSGVLNVGNGPDCTFKLLNIMQQVGGDVTLAPLVVPPNTVVNVPITFTDHPPFIAAGTTAHFILEFMRGDKKCKIEIQSAKFPACGDLACKCNTAGWGTFIASIKKQSIKVKCGHQFSLTCADTVSLKGLYKCIGKCEATYTAVLKNTATGVVVQNFSPFSFTWNYKFAAPGTYSLEITPTCGDTKCTPCRFFFTVRNCDTACDCNPDGWSKLEFTTSAGVQTLKCGDKLAVKKAVAARLNGKYTCKGSCAVKYTAVLINNATGAIIQNYPAFNFPYSYNFPAAGDYRLQITPICGNKKCQPCTIFFSAQ
ncbi:MAG: hypothetical protein ABIQ88_07955 [Chitinophagaceae bacterium]